MSWFAPVRSFSRSWTPRVALSLLLLAAGCADRSVPVGPPPAGGDGAARPLGRALDLPPTMVASGASVSPSTSGPIPVLADRRPLDPTRTYDLAGLIDYALANNPETREAWEKARQAALAVGLVEATYLPQLSAEVIGGVQHTPLPIPKSLIKRGFFTSDTREILPTLVAKWLLFDFGQRAGAEQAARADAFVANVGFTAAHQAVILAVSRDYFLLGAARGRLRVGEAALKTAETIEAATALRKVRGFATTLDLADAHRQTAKAALTLERARGAERTAYANLIASLGAHAPPLLTVVESADLPVPERLSTSLTALIDEAIQQRPDLQAASGKIRRAEAMVDAARARFYPTIGVEGQLYKNIGSVSTDKNGTFSVDEPGFGVFFWLNLPLFDGGTRQTGVDIARSELAAARNFRDKIEDGIAQQVTTAYEALSSGFAEYRASQVLTEAAQTAYDAAFDAYRQGVGTYTDLVARATRLDEARSDREDAHAAVFIAATSLAFATGTLRPPE